MVAITFDHFIGLDVRGKGAVQEAARLQVADNVYVNTAGKLQKRPGLYQVGMMPDVLDQGGKQVLVSPFLTAGFDGLVSFFIDSSNGSLMPQHLKTLSMRDGSAVAHYFIRLQMDPPEALEIEYVSKFGRNFYVIGRSKNGHQLQHHFKNTEFYEHPYYLATRVINRGEPLPSADSRVAAVQAASHIFMGDGEVVRFTDDVRDPTDWNDPDGSNFLPVGMHSAVGDGHVYALGVYQDRMVCFMKDSLQAWVVDPDPKNIQLAIELENIGTTYPSKVVNVGGDLMFLHSKGFRSLRYAAQNDRLLDYDIGTPIDALVTGKRMPLHSDAALFYPDLGQYISFGHGNDGECCFVYNVSRSSKISAWTTYTIPSVDGRRMQSAAMGNGKLFMLFTDVTAAERYGIFCFEELAYSDEMFGVKHAIHCVIELPWTDFQAPAQRKHIKGMDVVMQGNAIFKIGFDVGFPDAWIEIPMESGDSRPGGMIPIGVTGTEFRVRIEHKADEAFRLDSFTFYYDVLGVL